jgi:lipoprotein-releasing system ATP-binding protein
MHNMLEVKSLTKKYKEADSEFTALENLSLSVANKEKVAIIGRSGSGKSTLLNSIIGSISLDSGDILISGKSISDVSEDEMSIIRRDNIGVIYQQHHLLPDFTAIENIQIAQSISNELDLKQAKQSLVDVGLGHRGSHLPSELSGGERQRVAIARAIFKKPALIIADEPTGNLDVSTADTIMELLLGLPGALIMVTHDIDLAKKLDVIYELKNKSLYKI